MALETKAKKGKKGTKKKDDLEARLVARLPKVQQKEGLPLFERAEITYVESNRYAGSGASSILVYVVGYNPETRQLVHGDYVLPDNRVYQTGVLTVDAIRLNFIASYRPLPGPEEIFKR